MICQRRSAKELQQQIQASDKSFAWNIEMSQNVVVAAAAASLGAPPRRHRETGGGPPSADPSSGANGGGGGLAVGTSMSARYGENEWEAREVKQNKIQ